MELLLKLTAATRHGLNFQGSEIAALVFSGELEKICEKTPPNRRAETNFVNFFTTFMMRHLNNTMTAVIHCESSAIPKRRDYRSGVLR
jgi:hypothetical protein